MTVEWLSEFKIGFFFYKYEIDVNVKIDSKVSFKFGKPLISTSVQFSSIKLKKVVNI